MCQRWSCSVRINTEYWTSSCFLLSTTVPVWWEGDMYCWLLAHWHTDSHYTHGLRSPLTWFTHYTCVVELYKLPPPPPTHTHTHVDEVMTQPSITHLYSAVVTPYRHHSMMPVTKVCCWFFCKGRGVLTRLCFANSVARGWLESSTTDHGLLLPWQP